MCYLPNENDYAFQFVKRYAQLKADKKDEFLALRLSLDMFNFKLAGMVGANDMFDFTDKSGCYLCADGKFQFYQTK